MPQDSFADFDFDLARAVLVQLVEAFICLPVGRLHSTNLLRMKKRQGVYQLFENGELRYVGKAGNLQKRLSRHEMALAGRHGIAPETVGFKALYIHRNWTTWTTEEAMIRYFSPNHPLLWNTSGFGGNDPGRNRDSTDESDTFNNQHPINVDIGCTWLKPGKMSAWDALRMIKSRLPYTLRFQRVTAKRRGQAERLAEQILKNIEIKITKKPMTVREAIEHVASQLGAGWQATKLKGRIIIYMEKCEYEHGEVLYRS